MEVKTITYKIVLLILLIYSTITDLRERKIMMIPVYMCFVIVSIELIGVESEEKLFMTIAGVVPGIFLLLISFMSGEGIGRGDAYLTMAAGLMAGLEEIMWVLLSASVLAGLFALVLTVAKRRSSKEECLLKQEFPFVPFILCGYIGVLCMDYFRME